ALVGTCVRSLGAFSSSAWAVAKDSSADSSTDILGLISPSSWVFLSSRQIEVRHDGLVWLHVQGGRVGIDLAVWAGPKLRHRHGVPQNLRYFSTLLADPSAAAEQVSSARPILHPPH